MESETFSIVMASYLGDYKGAAKDRKAKFRRAVDSVLAQTYPHWELIVVADGCLDTLHILSEYTDPRIRSYAIDKQDTWSTLVRDMGIHEAKGDLIIYLDTDDTFGPEHLAKIVPPQGQWGYFNIFEWHGGKWVEKVCSVKERFKHGTGNLIHKPGLYWSSKGGYEHDYIFVQELRKLHEGEHLPTPEYFNCHIPNRYDK